MGASHRTQDRRLQHALVVRQALPSHEGRPALGELDHDGPVQGLAGFQDAVDGASSEA